MDNIFPGMSNESRSDVLNEKTSNLPERSVFPYGCERLTVMNEGYLIPVDTFFVIPGDSLDLTIAAYLETLNPFVDRQYSGMKLCFHAYYGKCEHQWRGWKAFSTRGHRGNISLKLPAYTPEYNQVNNVFMVDDSGVQLTFDGTRKAEIFFDGQNSLTSYLTGIPVCHYSNQSLPSAWTDSTFLNFLTSHKCGANTQVNRSFHIIGGISDSFEVSTKLVGNGIFPSFNAIPFVLYQRIFRDFYLNQNMVKDNKEWFPDDDDDFILPYSSSKPVSVTQHSSPAYNYKLVPNNVKSDSTHFADSPILGALRCRQWNGDAFTTSVPFLERNGDTLLFSPVKGLALYGKADFNGVSQLADFGSAKDIPNLTYAEVGTYVSSSALSNSEYSLQQGFSVDQSTAASVAYLKSVMSMNDFKQLAASTLWSVRNAKAKGDYNSLIMAHYGKNPHSEDKSPVYIGGAVQRVEFNNVVSQTETTNQPLGTKTSIASCGLRANLGHFEVPDFGYVMIIASLVPDTYYNQGLRPEFDPSITGAELPWPEFANLQKENVLAKRLFAFRGSSDNVLLGFNERFLDYKYRDNRLLGSFADYADSKFRSMTFARIFDNALGGIASINNEFVTCSPQTLRDDMYSVPSQPHFTLQFGDNIRLVRALPYAAKEMSLTNVA